MGISTLKSWHFKATEDTGQTAQIYATQCMIRKLSNGKFAIADMLRQLCYDTIVAMLWQL